MEKIAIIDFDMSVFGGVEKVTEQVANGLSNYYDVVVISLNHTNQNLVYKLDNRIKYYPINETKNNRIRGTIKFTRKKIRKIIKEEKIEKIVTMGDYCTFCTIINLFGIRKKIVYEDHGAIINQINDKTVTMIKRFNSIFSKRIVVLTDINKEDYCKIFKTKKNKIVKICNPICIEEKKEEYKVDSNKIITATRFSKEKGLDMLIQVATELKKYNDNWIWDIYGDGKEFDNIKEMIEKNGLKNHVILKGYCDNVKEQYKNYAMCVLTSYREGLPVVLLEAKEKNLPIVSFDINTGPREVVENNVNGFLIEPYNIELMAKKINELLNDKEKRIMFSKNAKKDIEKFDERKIIEQWCDLLKNL